MAPIFKYRPMIFKYPDNIQIFRYGLKIKIWVNVRLTIRVSSCILNAFLHQILVETAHLVDELL